MITRLPLIDSGWSVSREHVNDTRVKLNEVIDVFNALGVCGQCRGTGVMNYSSFVDGGILKMTCPECEGAGVRRPWR